MYREFYGIEFNPFEKESLNKAFESTDYEEISKKFDYLIKTKGLGLFTGLSGTGKTFSIRTYLEKTNLRNFKVYYITSSSVSNVQFYRALCYEMKIDATHRKVDMLNRIKEEIVRIYKENKLTPVLIIDEAQLLNDDILIDLIILLNYVYDSRNYLTIALIGTESLSSKISRTCFEGLKQRISTRYSTNGLSKEEFEKYVESSLKNVGCTSRIFEPSVINAIYSHSNGILRVACQYLTKCLIKGAEREDKVISNETLELIYGELVF